MFKFYLEISRSPLAKYALIFAGFYENINVAAV